MSFPYLIHLFTYSLTHLGYSLSIACSVSNFGIIQTRPWSTHALENPRLAQDTNETEAKTVEDQPLTGKGWESICKAQGIVNAGPHGSGFTVSGSSRDTKWVSWQIFGSLVSLCYVAENHGVICKGQCFILLTVLKTREFMVKGSQRMSSSLLGASHNSTKIPYFTSPLL